MSTNHPSTAPTSVHTGIRREAIRVNAERRAKNLALFGLGIGLVEVVGPGALARAIGVRNTRRTRSLLLVCGIRELATSAGLLVRPQAGFVWARLAGDILNLGLLTHSLRSGRGNNKARVATAAVAVLGLVALDAGNGARLSRQRSVQKLAAPIHVTKSITVSRSPEEVYAFWRNLENLPHFMEHLESVRVQNGTSTWRAKAPGGSVEWQAEIVMDKPNEAIAWRSLEGTLVPNQGVVRFLRAPGGRGTQVLVELKYDPPGGMLAQTVAKLFGEEPGQQIAGDLRRLKQVLEIGEVVHSDASIHRTMHAARPPDISSREATALRKAYT